LILMKRLLLPFALRAQGTAAGAPWPADTPGRALPNTASIGGAASMRG